MRASAQVYSTNLVIQDGLVHKNAFRQQGPYTARTIFTKEEEEEEAL